MGETREGTVRHWTSRQRAQRGERPHYRVDMRGPLGHPRHVPKGKEWESDAWTRLADFVLAKRDELDLSQQQLADRMKVDVKTVRAIEKRKSVAQTTLSALDRALEVEIGTARRILDDRDNEPLAQTPRSTSVSVMDLQREYEYFHRRLRDNPEDFPRLMRLLNMYLELELRERGYTTDSGRSTGVG